MTDIFLARHGMYDNPKHIIPFRSNEVVLSKEGEEQINNNSKILKPFGIDGIFSSPVLRASETAKIYSDNLGVKLEIDNRLTEMDSPYQGFDLDKFFEMKHGRSLYTDPYHVDNGGETVKEIIDRMSSCVFEKFGVLYNILFVSHGDPIMLFVAREIGKPLDFRKPLEGQIDYLPMGGIIKLSYDNAGKFFEYKKINF